MAASAQPLSLRDIVDQLYPCRGYQAEGMPIDLHCFQKKSKRGIETSSKELDLIAQRLKLAIADSKGTTP